MMKVFFHVLYVCVQLDSNKKLFTTSINNKKTKKHSTPQKILTRVRRRHRSRYLLLSLRLRLVARNVCHESNFLVFGSIDRDDVDSIAVLHAVNLERRPVGNHFASTSLELEPLSLPIQLHPPTMTIEQYLDTSTEWHSIPEKSKVASEILILLLLLLLTASTLRRQNPQCRHELSSDSNPPRTSIARPPRRSGSIRRCTRIRR